MAGTEPVRAPDSTYVRQRWIQTRYVEWASESNKIMLSHGAVYGTDFYDSRHKARWKARHLKSLMVALRMHEGWELKEHVEKRPGGWQWSLEYVGGRSNAGRTPAA